MTHTPIPLHASNALKTAMQETFYLARVGAFRYLDALHEALSAKLGPSRVPAVPADHGFVPRPEGYREPLKRDTPPRFRNTAVFPDTYEPAERNLLSVLDKLDTGGLVLVAKRLAEGLAEGESSRATMLAMGQALPGRGSWLVSELAVRRYSGDTAPNSPSRPNDSPPSVTEAQISPAEAA